MSAHGWSITYPQTVAFGARVVAVPGRGSVLCASVIIAFRLDDGDIARPADWYEAVRAYGGDDAVPDAVAPLPRAEVLVLGGVGPLAAEECPCTVRCGASRVELLLRGDPAATGTTGFGPEAAVWHEEDNPGGRGGPGDDRRPLIVGKDRPERPVWLGPTSYLHPIRQRRLGMPGSGPAGWPEDASGAALHDAHEAFWVDGLFPGDPLQIDGIPDGRVDVDLPPYRVEMAACVMTESEPLGEWSVIDSRIHTLTVVPRAGLGAAIWRASISLGEDIMGEKVVALVAGLDDAGAPARDHTVLADAAAERWLRPELALDDRPLLPESLHGRVAPPFEAAPDGEPSAARLAAAKEWANGEMGIERNPFDAGGDHDELVAMAQDASPAAGEMDPDRMGEVADAVMARAKKAREAAGFGDDARPEQRPEVARGDTLEAEIDNRLSRPHQAPHELAVAENLARHPTGVDAAEMLGRLAGVRIQSPEPTLSWPPFPPAEALSFGEALLGRLRGPDLPLHIDVSGALVGDAPDADIGQAAAPDTDDIYEWSGEKPPSLRIPAGDAPPRSHALRDRRFEGLLAEETGWRGIVFERCVFDQASFARGEIVNCEFVDCEFEHVNFAGVVFSDCRFESCAFRELTAYGTVWRACDFTDCRLEKTPLNESGMRDVTFEGGGWRDVQLSEGLVMDVRLVGLELEDITFTMVRSAYMVFERVSMRRVVALARGFPYATFRDADIRTCGFTGCHFDFSVWENVRAEEVGLTNGVFTGARVDEHCDFQRCDFTGAAFIGADIAGARLVECTLTASQWSGADATATWFFGSALRGVDFADAHLARAVFCGADLNGTVFPEGETIGADFTGTTREDGQAGENAPGS